MLKRVIDKIEDVEENLRSLYVQRQDGKYRLDAEPDEGGDLKVALAKARQERTKLEERLAIFKDVDIERYRTLETAQAELDEQRAAAAGEWDKLKASLAEKHTAELARRDDEIKALTATIQHTLVDAEAEKAVAAARGSSALLKPHIISRTRVVRDGDRFVVRVLSEKGEDRVSPASGNDELMTIAELVEEMRGNELYGRAFDGSGVSGSGAPSHIGNGGAAANQTRAKMDDNAKAAYIHDHGMDAYLELPAD